MMNHEKQFFFRHASGEAHPFLKKNSLTYAQKKTFEQFCFHQGNVPEETIAIIDSINQQTEHIIDKLIPFYQIGIKFDINIHSDTIVDLLWFGNHPIDNLDFIICIDSSNLDSIFKTTPRLNFYTFFGKEIDGIVNWNTDSHVEIVYKIIQFCLSEDFNFGKCCYQTKTYSRKNEFSSTTTFNKVTAIVHAKTITQKYSLNLKIIETSILDYIEKEVDFNILKTYVNFMSKESPYHRPYNVFTFLERLSVSKDFLEDLIHQRITLDMKHHEGIVEVERILDNRWPFYHKKYPQYSLNIEPGKEPTFISWKTSYEKYKELDGILPKNENTENQKFKL